MGVQDDVAHACAQVGGWKVGFGPDGVPFAGPLYQAGSRVRPRPTARPRRSRDRVELAFRLARDLPPGRYAAEALLAAID